MRGLGAAYRGDRVAGDHFDECQREQETAYSKSALAFPRVQENVDGGGRDGDSIRNHEWWVRKLQAFVARRVDEDGDKDARATTGDGVTVGGVVLKESEIASIWGFDQVKDTSNDNVESLSWHPKQEEVESNQSTGSCRNEETMPRLKKLDIEANSPFPNGLWHQRLCDENIALLCRVTLQQGMQNLETSYKSQTRLNRDEEADWLGTQDRPFMKHSDAPPAESQLEPHSVRLRPLRTMEIPRSPAGFAPDIFASYLKQSSCDLLSTALVQAQEIGKQASFAVFEGSKLMWMTFAAAESSIDLDRPVEIFPATSSKHQRQVEKDDDLSQMHQMKRLKNDPEIRVPVAFLSKESTWILKQAIRKNAQVLLVLPTSKKLEVLEVPQLSSIVASTLNPWFGSFKEITGASVADSVLKSELRQLSLPSSLLRRDESKRDEALLHMIDSGKGLLFAIKSSSNGLAPRPLTSIMLNMPSLWSQESFQIAELSKPEEKLDWTPVAEISTTTIPQNKATPEFIKNNEPLTSIEDEAQEVELSSSPPEIMNMVSPTKAPLSARITDAIPSKVIMFADKGPTTTEDLVHGFFEMAVSYAAADPGRQLCTEISATPVSGETAQTEKLIERFARPVLWDLIRKKVLHVNSNSISLALEALSLELLESTIFQEQANVKKLSKNPSAFSHETIFETCTSFRQLSWLHTLRLTSMRRAVAICGRQNLGEPNAPLLFVGKIFKSSTYKSALGALHWKDLSMLLHCFGEDPSSTTDSTKLRQNDQLKDTSSKSSFDQSIEPPLKKQKLLGDEREYPPVRLICSVQFLSHDEILDELSTEYAVSVIERDMQCPIDLLVDERNGICVLSTELFTDTNSMKALTYKLATSQIQFQCIWIIIGTRCTLVSTIGFHDVQKLYLSASDEETSRCIRSIVDVCAQTALSDYRTLPRMWFERPFLLEEESQQERLLASTQIISPYAAQSLLHRISIDDLFSSSLERLERVVQDSVTEDQLRLLWRMMQQNHGLPQQFGG
ncbi:hypothetical protein FI667_g13997, partial [Globisporangium splendens]